MHISCRNQGGFWGLVFPLWSIMHDYRCVIMQLHTDSGPLMKYIWTKHIIFPILLSLSMIFNAQPTTCYNMYNHSTQYTIHGTCFMAFTSSSLFLQKKQTDHRIDKHAGVIYYQLCRLLCQLSYHGNLAG